MLSASFLSGQSWSGQMPFPGAAVCVWGADYDCRQSNAYLGCMPADTATVQGAEAQAVPMLSTWDNTSHTPLHRRALRPLDPSARPIPDDLRQRRL